MSARLPLRVSATRRPAGHSDHVVPWPSAPRGRRERGQTITVSVSIPGGPQRPWRDHLENIAAADRRSNRGSSWPSSCSTVGPRSSSVGASAAVALTGARGSTHQRGSAQSVAPQRQNSAPARTLVGRTPDPDAERGFRFRAGRPCRGRSPTSQRWSKRITLVSRHAPAEHSRLRLPTARRRLRRWRASRRRRVRARRDPPLAAAAARNRDLRGHVVRRCCRAGPSSSGAPFRS